MKYITNDIEASGPRLGYNTPLSFGACVVVREKLKISEYMDNNLVFYAEVKPSSYFFDKKAMKVGVLHLECLDKIRITDSRYDPKHRDFEPILVLELMNDVCEDSKDAFVRFKDWVDCVSQGSKIEGVTDTVFFDSGHLDLGFGLNIDEMSPYGWHGLDLSSLYRGYTGKEKVHINRLVKDTRVKPHKADHDAVFLAQIARVLLFEKLGW